MAAEKYKYSYIESVQGNTVRKWETAPAREGYRRPIPQQVERTMPHRRNHPIQGLDVFSMLFMTAAVAVTLYMCISYIQVQFSITSMEKKIAVTESQINNLKNENDAAYNKIDTSVDLECVYQIAVGELGMIRADKSQIIPYMSVKSDYVRQYGSIPEGKKSALERVLTKNVQ